MYKETYELDLRALERALQNTTEVGQAVQVLNVFLATQFTVEKAYRHDFEKKSHLMLTVQIRISGIFLC